MTKIFISYRREDSGMGAGRIYDRLEARFGAENLFFDIDSIPLGVDFRKYLDQKIRSCDVVLAVIGKSWLSTEDEAGQRRLDSPQDFVRTEIELALQRDIPVIPVLLDGVGMPTREDLPSNIAELAYRQAAIVDSVSFAPHMKNLIRGLEYFITPDVQNAEAVSDLSQEDKRAMRVKSESPATPVTKASTGLRPEAKSSEKPSSPQTGKEAKRFLAEIDDLETAPRRRLEIGDRLAKLDDPRPGVGLDEQGLPDIDWVEIPAGSFIYGEEKQKKQVCRDAQDAKRDIPVPLSPSLVTTAYYAPAALRPCRFATPSQARRWLRSTPTNG